MRKYKTTKKHFKMFKKEFRKWYKKFGLNEYRLEFEHVEMEDNRAIISYDIQGKVCLVSLNKIFIDTERLSNKYLKWYILCAAKHEAVELLVGELYVLAKWRFVNEDEIQRACHTLIRRIQSVI